MLELTWPWVLAALPLPYFVYRLATRAPRQDAALYVPFFSMLSRLQSDGDSSACLLYTSPSPRDQRGTRMPSSA